MDLAGLARALRTEAERSDERRAIVLAGDRDAGYEAARLVLEASGVAFEDATIVGPPNPLPAEQVPTERADTLLGTTKEAVLLDVHEQLRPNAVGQVVGGVDGGGLFVLLAPPLEEWTTGRDGFDERLAVPPFSVEDVGGRFRRRFVERLRVHRGIAVVDVDGEWVEDDGLTDPAPRLDDGSASGLPDEFTFPQAVYERCLTGEQAEAVGAFEGLRAPNQALVLEADRGRGKSSAAGLAAAALALEGEDVLVTGPHRQAVGPVFDRVGEVLDASEPRNRADGPEPARDRRSGERSPDGTDDGDGVLRVVAPSSVDDPRTDDPPGDDPPDEGSRDDAPPDGGTVRFRPPDEATDHLDEADVVVVDEAAALPVSQLEAMLEADRVAFATTVHGYEGTGRGFSVRFRDSLESSDHAVTELRLDEPIRYAAGDPVEAWAFDALLLDARPAVDQIVEDATPAAVSYRRLEPEDLLADEHLLREAFGLLVLAHYRTEPDDLARLLDAPNVAIRALLVDDHVASVALLAREGGLSAEWRGRMYDGDRIRGNMLPDVLTSQLRDERAAVPIGARVLRIATHPAVRSRGLGSRLLARVRTEATNGFREWEIAPTPPEHADRTGLDWLGVGYGATPGLVSFWAANGYRTVHLATTRNRRSGEYSVLMVNPLTEAGQELHDRTARRFGRRIGGVLGDSLDDADVDVVRAALAATDATATPPLNLTDWEWRVVAGAAFGPGLADVAPDPFTRLAVRHLGDPADEAALTPRQERLLVRKAVQRWDWPAVQDDLDFHSTGACMRAYGDVFEPLVSLYGTDVAHEERERYLRGDETPALEGETLPGEAGGQETTGGE